MEGDLTQGSEHTIQYTDDVLQNVAVEMYTILLTNVTPINSMKILKHTQKEKNLDFIVHMCNNMSQSHF